mmetsp:Transcript_37402/g.92513  ORF Transcript_37402/g.92513 Transcript_37402/m.92513 type:complete len:298 (-) Transcript_37402:301-1194(-)|eukprot:CAMPEP_0197575672 /NCGR_PEP_ID=MMETSP1326-20131121/989_1 /TAXON_ID=1155430 /ORGANISM="Genus nov. species nov., Strain RCC2288" /LENGTH=297 /DNA_ID=CAMNT_0043138481 /DNA_START=131 /DNA_END=1024 /DNA_ORIENTATION=-
MSKMVAFALSTAGRALARPTATVSSATSRSAVSVATVRPSAAVAVSASFATVPAFGARAAATRGIFGISAAPIIVSSRAAVQQRAAFSVSAMAEESVGGGGGGEGVKLYVGNLSWGMNDDSLREVFSDFSVGEVTVVFDSVTGRSRGFGFVHVNDESQADAVIQSLDGVEVDGRSLKVNVSAARTERGPMTPREPRAPREGGFAGNDKNFEFDARKVYFGNLSWGMDHLDLQDLCSEIGAVEDSRLITDRETGRSRGFGFVTMASVKEAEEVVNQLNGQDVDGRVLRVNIANVDRPM